MQGLLHNCPARAVGCLDLVLDPERHTMARRSTAAAVADQSSVAPPGYSAALRAITDRIRTAQLEAAAAASSILVVLYWDVGHLILTEQARYGWVPKSSKVSQPICGGCSRASAASQHGISSTCAPSPRRGRIGPSWRTSSSRFPGRTTKCVLRSRRSRIVHRQHPSTRNRPCDGHRAVE